MRLHYRRFLGLRTSGQDVRTNVEGSRTARVTVSGTRLSPNLGHGHCPMRTHQHLRQRQLGSPLRRTDIHSDLLKSNFNDSQAGLDKPLKPLSRCFPPTWVKARIQASSSSLSSSVCCPFCVMPRVRVAIAPNISTCPVPTALQQDESPSSNNNQFDISRAVECSLWCMASSMPCQYDGT